MPSDSYYDRLDEAEYDAWVERKRKLREEFSKMTLEQKVDFLINKHIDSQK